ncbi:aminotransferase class I/II-fold pyridoxal phosphate-dependent enzyme [Calderihabitans maritimus]|uniref:Arginine decarboxylase n=1 Tax=Calderihabitans maritimus TaxID=1246530 RepID=A0A1Z5HQ07_9FIRM|nr:aminotransferase class I/II-fold pyridoxal phosphate-dependent enzyme [Calderihabitans maritimus]GAW91613.1 Arginine decarboxylase [Calderihabitans maritimus]
MDPILDALIQYVGGKYINLHTPGHKQGCGINPKFREMLGEKSFSFDLTEVPGLDNLHQPQGIIKQAQELAARCFGAGETYFLVNGATAGILASLMAICRPGDYVLVPRHAHRSVWGGMVLTGIRPVYYKPEIHPRWGIPLGISPEDIQDKLFRQNCKAVLILHPTYHGMVSDLKSIVNIAHAHGVTVISDEAHGAHFAFHSRLPVSGMAAGADIAVHGTHKTLGALTQTGMLHVHPTAVGRWDIQQALSIVQTTSPSYLFLASLDAVRSQMQVEGPKLMEEVISIAETVRTKIASIKGIHCLGRELYQYPSLVDYDLTKLVISAVELGLTGYQLAKELRNSYSIEVEMADFTTVLMLITIGDNREIGDKIVKALQDLAERYKDSYLRCRCSRQRVEKMPSLPKVLMSPRDAYFAPKRDIPLQEAVGKVAGEIVAPYPPGIPVVCPGEEITYEIVNYLVAVREQGVVLQASKNSLLNRIRIIEV